MMTIRFMRICAEFAGEGRQMRQAVSSSKMTIFASFAHYIFRTFTYTRPQLLHCNYVYSRGNQSLSDFSMTPEQITLNDPEWLLCVNVCLGIDISWVCVFWLSDKNVWKFAYYRPTVSVKKLQSYAETSFWRRISFKRQSTLI